MRCSLVVSSLLASVAVASAGRSLASAGKRILPKAAENWAQAHGESAEKRAASTPSFLNANTSSFAVNGSALPDVYFDVGESYAGVLPISDLPDEESKMYFWFFPSTNEDAGEEILIWLNGGPGCSSLEGILQENGPFLWQYGTFLPYPNPWSWHTLTNVVWVDQPIGTGFSTGKVTATDEEDVAAQFMGFWKNFVKTFSMQGYKVYIAGESYAGMYCPYISDGFLNANDKTYYNLAGMSIFDPVITWDEIQEPIPAVQFIDYWGGLFPFNDTFRETLNTWDEQCGYTAWVEEYLVYPPKGEIPMPLPGTNAAGNTRDECWNIYNDAFDAASELNPCFDIYQVATTCPLLWDVLGFPGSFGYTPTGATVYFNRTDVQKAINAPLMEWEECTDGNVFVDGNDNSLPSALTVLPHVIDATKNVVIGGGALDMIILANGTLLAIQNMTWGGQLGFQTRPVEPLYVPYHDDQLATLAGAGVFGTAHTERGLTFVGVDLSGHMIPQYAPSAAYRIAEFLLGRVDCLNCTVPFTSQPGIAQSTQPLGYGTAPQGYSTSGGGAQSKPKMSRGQGRSTARRQGH